MISKARIFTCFVGVTAAVIAATWAGWRDYERQRALKETIQEASQPWITFNTPNVTAHLTNGEHILRIIAAYQKTRECEGTIELAYQVVTPSSLTFSHSMTGIVPAALGEGMWIRVLPLGRTLTSGEHQFAMIGTCFRTNRHGQFVQDGPPSVVPHATFVVP